MRLEGSLDAFSLPDIFQLLSFTKKTGGLHLRRGDATQHGVVYVTTGSLTGGSSNVGRQALARRLIGIGIVDDDALRAAVEAAGANGELGVARALQQHGHIDEAQLHEVASEHVIDTVFDLLRWPEGDFAFVVDETNPDDVGVSVDVEAAVEEARRRLDGWSHVSTTIPSPEAVLAVAMSPAGDPALSRDEWALLALVDGRRPVAEIVSATGRGEFAVVSALASLVDRGLLVVTTESAPPAAQVLLRRVSALTGLEGVPAPDVHQRQPEEPSATSALAEAFTTSTPAQRAPEYADDAALTARPAEPPELVAEDYPAGDDSDVASLDALVTEPAPVDELGDVDRDRADGEPDRGSRLRTPSVSTRRRADHADEDVATAGALVMNQIEGTAAIADPVLHSVVEDGTSGPNVIERDPSVNKSLLLRLIAGVRGL